MLGKIIQYEFKSNRRILLPFYGLVIAVSLFLRLLFFIAPLIWPPIQEYIVFIFPLFNFAISISVFILTSVVLFARFYQSMLATEAYLTFTLPVKVSTLINGKILASLLWSILSWGITFLSEKIVNFGHAPNTGTIHFADTTIFIHDIPIAYRAQFYLVVTAFSLVVATGFLVKIFAAMAFGSQFGKNKILGSIVSYFITNVIEGFISVFLLFAPFAFFVGSSPDSIERYFSQFQETDPLLLFQNSMSFMCKVFMLITAVHLLFTIIYYVFTHYIFSKRLNLT